MVTYVKDLPKCKARFGRTQLVEKNDKLIPRFALACGYRYIDAEECIECRGFTRVRLELKIDTFIVITKGKKYKVGDNVD